MSDKPVWLPNLVGGVSIWKLAPDLNEPKFMGGRLLVPATEGSESLPSTVRWDVAGLVPLAEARARHGEELAAATRDFTTCLAKVSEAFASEASGYSKYKDAFTVPSLEADGGANYFYSPADKKLKVINWGASPRSIAGSAELFFGWQNFAKLAASAAVAVEAAGAQGAPAAAVASPPQGLASAPGEEKPEGKDAEKKKEDRARPIWFWVLLVVGLVGLILLVLWLLRACDHPLATRERDAAPDAPTALSEAGPDAPRAADGAAASPDAGAADAPSSDAMANDAGEDARLPESKDGSAKDGGGRKFRVRVKRSAGNGGGGSGGGGGGGGGGEGDTVEVDGEELPHRTQFHPDAVRWRVEAGKDQLVDGQPAAAEGNTFEVFLKPDGSFQNVRIAWQDKDGKWHH